MHGPDLGWYEENKPQSPVTKTVKGSKYLL